MKTIISLSCFFCLTFLAIAQPLASLDVLDQKIEITKDSTRITEHSSILFSGPTTTEEHEIFGQVLNYHAGQNKLAFSKLPKEGFMLSFWFSVEDFSQSQSLLLHQSSQANTYPSLELFMEKGQLLIYKKEEATNKKVLQRSRDSIESNHWYQVIYVYANEQVKIKVRSTGFDFDALHPVNLDQADDVFFGKNSIDYSFRGSVSRFDLFAYNKAKMKTLQKTFNKYSNELFGYHRRLDATSEKGRMVVDLATIAINKQEFFIDIWDYDETDGDVLKIMPKDGIAINRDRIHVSRPDPEIEVKLDRKKEKQTIRVLLPVDGSGTLVFRAIDMGYVETLNTATIRVFTQEEHWDTLHIKTNLKKDIRLKFEFDPMAVPRSKGPQIWTTINPDAKYKDSKSQKIELRISDFSKEDGDEVLIQLNEQKPMIQKLGKRPSALSLLLDQKENVIHFKAAETKRRSCTAKIELYIQNEKGVSQRIFNKNVKIEDNEMFILPISFDPRQDREHHLLVRDSAIFISVFDPQKIDKDTIKVSLDNGWEEVIELSDQEKVLKKINLQGEKKKRLSFIALSKGEMNDVANLCKVIVKNTSNVILAEYTLQMVDIRTPSVIQVEYME